MPLCDSRNERGHPFLGQGKLESGRYGAEQFIAGWIGQVRG